MGAKLNERIAALENKIKNAAETALVERIAHLEQQFKNDVENKLMGWVTYLLTRLLTCAFSYFYLLTTNSLLVSLLSLLYF